MDNVLASPCKVENIRLIFSKNEAREKKFYPIFPIYILFDYITRNYISSSRLLLFANYTVARFNASFRIIAKVERRLVTPLMFRDIWQSFRLPYLPDPT